MERMTAKDLMTRGVITINPLMEIAAAARLLTEHGISGAPVVDKEGRVLGVVSQTDLTRFQGRHGERDPFGQREDPDDSPVLSVMSDRPVTCGQETPAEDIARIMLERRIHRVLVLEDGRLSGIVTAMDLLRAWERVWQAQA